MNQAFRTNILLPVYIDMACRMGAPDMYHDTEASDTNLQPPPGFSILATKAKLVRKFQSKALHVCQMITQLVYS